MHPTLDCEVQGGPVRVAEDVNIDAAYPFGWVP